MLKLHHTLQCTCTWGNQGYEIVLLIYSLAKLPLYSNQITYVYYACCLLLVCRVMKNAKVLAERLQEAKANVPLLQKRLAHANIEFRTLDKDINTVRPLLMKLKREKDHYTR